jgi:hypothetical protein
VVLKVASPKLHVQWYYDRLIPWKHFVPVKSDLSDLKAMVSFALDPANKANLTSIATEATNLAKSLTYSDELQHAHDRIASFIHMFATPI